MFLDKVDFSRVYGAVTCCSVFCDDSTHKTSCATLCDQLISVCLKASEATFPLCAPSHVRLPMWNEHIRPLRDHSLFWHWLWKEAGRPAAGALAAIMRSTRAKYHKAVKMHKSKQMSTRRSVIAKCVSDGLNRDFWREIKKLESKNKTMPSAVDGFTDDGDIANSFAQKYSKFKSVPTSHQEIADLRGQTTNDFYI